MLFQIQYTNTIQSKMSIFDALTRWYCTFWVVQHQVVYNFSQIQKVAQLVTKASDLQFFILIKWNRIQGKGAIMLFLSFDPFGFYIKQKLYFNYIYSLKDLDTKVVFDSRKILKKEKKYKGKWFFHV